MELLFQHISIELTGFLLLFISFAISYILIPKLILVVQYKKLMDNPDQRSSHTQQTPTLGGVAFFVSIVLSLFFIQGLDHENLGIPIIAALTILFIVGLKDDLMVLAPKTKILAQLMAITFILFNTEILPVNFYGFLGLSEIPVAISIVFSYFMILCIINAYNLIDGIDGLAAIIGIIIFTVFAFIFYGMQLYFYSLFALIGIGFLAAFLPYNLSSNKKIFMGDTGSMIVGFMIGILSLRFLASNVSELQQIQIKPENLLFITIAILFILFMDTIRVVVIRLLNHKGAFSPDRNHVHHILIDKGISHIKASIGIGLYAILVVLLFFELNFMLSAIGMFMVLLLVSVFTVLLLFQWNRNFSALKQKIKIRAFFLGNRSSWSKESFHRGKMAGIFRLFF